MRWPSQLRRRLCIVMPHSSVLDLVYSSMLVIILGQCMPKIFLRCPYLERVDCIFQFFGESPQFAVVEEYTCYICIEGSDFDCVADFSAVKMLFSVLKASIARIVMRFMTFSVSSKLPSILHLFHFSLPCRIISYSSVLDSLITRLRFARVDGVVSLIYAILCLAVVAQFRINFEIFFCFSL